MTPGEVILWVVAALVVVLGLYLIFGIIRAWRKSALEARLMRAKIKAETKAAQGTAPTVILGKERR